MYSKWVTLKLFSQFSAFQNQQFSMDIRDHKFAQECPISKIQKPLERDKHVLCNNHNSNNSSMCPEATKASHFEVGHHIFDHFNFH